MSWLRALTMLGMATLVGCATPVPTPPPAAEVIAEPPPSAQPVLRRDTLKHLANRDLKPIKTRPLNAKASCGFRDPSGYRGRLKLDVKEASVNRFEASVDVPKKGSCSFNLKDFQQTDHLPNVVLAAKKGDCKVSLWEQEHRVTVAFRDCRAECSGNSVEYLWPILVDNQKGSCS
ncbi:MAG: hypothetical protein Q8M20_14215 [Rhodocyclaceae bacterium]|nr:hypothetical protein [Rhodocyclaceae bacterium]MDZ4216156.1 hypothetical protein [Rhodocyclaceae bacterium]